MVKSKPQCKIRETNRADVSALIALNRAAYPTLASENVVWGESYLLNIAGVSGGPVRRGSSR
ncbi:MAG: hypothetical protein ABIQ35_04360 [Verrucomicrobiota bacterium]